MKKLFGKSGFTLVEVNLAVFIMAAGVLAMLALYPLGYRENQQSVEDVKAAAYADALLNQIAGSLSARALTWNQWESAVGAAVQATGSAERSGGWGAYCNTGTDDYTPKKRGEVNSLANKVFQSLISGASKSGANASWPVDNNLTTAIVAQWGTTYKPGTGYVEDHTRCSVSLRVSHNSGSLFGQPLFYTEIHFQGDQEKAE